MSAYTGEGEEFYSASEDEVEMTNEDVTEDAYEDRGADEDQSSRRYAALPDRNETPSPAVKTTTTTTGEYHRDGADAKTDTDLPERWQQLYDENGYPYFYNTATQRSQWERPQERVSTRDDVAGHRKELEHILDQLRVSSANLSALVEDVSSGLEES